MAKILVVDDDEDLSIMVSDKLMLERYDVEVVHNGKNAHEQLRTGNFDLLILDWDLPDTTGVEICKQFRAAGGIIPVLMLTGRGGVENKEEGFDAGADDYLTKPFEMKELASRVKALLRRAAVSTPPPKPADAEVPIHIGSMIDNKYRLDEFIGQGGMALIYKATHVAMQKPVVVKLVQAHLLEEETSMQRFKQECLLMSRINHGNVVSAFDTGLLNGKQPFLVMEYIKGETLSEIIASRAPLPMTEALEIMIQVCRGLEAAHAAGVIHRDLKPDNIVVKERSSDPSWVKILDFGIAHLAENKQRLTQPDILMGSAGYISPEQLRGLDLDERVDIYALGVILFQMLTKSLPFKATNTEAFLVKQVLEQPDLLSTQRADIAAGSAIESIVSRALEKDPDQRYQTVTSLRLELEQLMKLEVMTRPDFS